MISKYNIFVLSKIKVIQPIKTNISNFVIILSPIYLSHAGKSQLNKKFYTIYFIVQTVSSLHNLRKKYFSYNYYSIYMLNLSKPSFYCHLSCLKT